MINSTQFLNPFIEILLPSGLTGASGVLIIITIVKCVCHFLVGNDPTSNDSSTEFSEVSVRYSSSGYTDEFFTV